MTQRRSGLPAVRAMRADLHLIEELTRPVETGIGRMMGVDRLEPHPDQPRKNFDGLDDLVRSVQERGVLEPLLVTPGDDGRFRIVAGERRFRAAREAGLTEVPVMVMELSESDQLEVALVENIQRRDLTPFEEADALATLVRQFGHTHQQLADRLGKGRTAVTESLLLAEVPGVVRTACLRNGISSKRLLLEVARAGAEKQQLQMAERIAKGQLGRDEARASRPARVQPLARKPAGKTPGKWTWSAPEGRFGLTLRVSRPDVPREELLAALEALLEEIRSARR